MYRNIYMLQIKLLLEELSDVLHSSRIVKIGDCHLFTADLGKNKIKEKGLVG